jgi:hypothetical protein
VCKFIVDESKEDISEIILDKRWILLEDTGDGMTPLKK